MKDQIIRVFPRKTTATPIDDMVRFDEPGLFEPENVDEVHVSVAFTYDLPKAEKLLKAWEKRFPGKCKIGGPAIGMAGGDFTPGMYLKTGYVITSRGCPNRCWFCSVWRREGPEIRELPIFSGWNILDDNLLACSDSHILEVFAMLDDQPRRPEFTGGLEAARLQQWHVDALRKLKPKQMFFAYDTPDDLEPLRTAGKMLLSSGFTTASHVLRAYVLIGHPLDSFDQAEKRLKETIEAGFMPMAMLWKNKNGDTNLEWRKFQRKWARPALIAKVSI